MKPRPPKLRVPEQRYSVRFIGGEVCHSNRFNDEELYRATLVIDWFEGFIIKDYYRPERWDRLELLERRDPLELLERLYYGD